MKYTLESRLFFLPFVIWAIGRFFLVFGSVWLISETGQMGHLKDLKFLYWSAWLEVVAGTLSLLFSLLLFRSSAKMVKTSIYILALLTTISGGYLTYVRYFIHYTLEYENLSQAIMYSIWVLFNIYIAYTISRLTSERRQSN